MPEALPLAHQLGHPFSMVHALDCAAWLHVYRREERLAYELVDAATGFATEQQIAFFLSHGTIFRGWALVEQGLADEGLARIHEGIAAYRATGAVLELPFWLALQAEAFGRAGHPAGGLPVVAAGLAEVQQRGWRFCEAELPRLRGELLRQHDVQSMRGCRRKLSSSYRHSVATTDQVAGAPGSDKPSSPW